MLRESEPFPPVEGDQADGAQMNMLWNHDVENVCVVFPSWHISGPGTMLLSW